MTPSRRALASIDLLSLDNKVGDGVPAREDLIKVQAAILLNNATVLGAVTEFRTGIDQRLTREFGDVATQIGDVSTKLDGVCAEVSMIKSERREEAVRAEERTANAEKAVVAEDKHAAIAMNERHDQAAQVASNILSRHWRITLLAGIATSIGISLLNFVMNH